MDLSASLARTAALLDEADGLIIAAGAGMGVDSGLPDFRGNEGFWKAYPALGAAGLKFTEVASPATFERDPHLAWGFYGHRLRLYRDTEPHEGFGILRRWAAGFPQGAFVFTSNVDGQFQKAGFDPDRVAEVHGSLHHLQCMGHCEREIWPADGLEPDIDVHACLWRGELPVCLKCGGLARPNVLMFGDYEWLGGRSWAQDQWLEDWLSRVRAPVVVEIGAGTAVPSVRYFSEDIGRVRKGRLIRINPDDCRVQDSRDVSIPLRALEALLRLDEVWGRGVNSRETPLPIPFEFEWRGGSGDWVVTEDGHEPQVFSAAG